MLPHALAHRLAKFAPEDIASGDLKAFSNTASERLLKFFSRRLGCLHDNTQAQKIVGEWLAIGGKVSEVGSLTPLGMVIFDNIAPVYPEAVLLASLQRSLITRRKLNSPSGITFIEAPKQAGSKEVQVQGSLKN